MRKITTILVLAVLLVSTLATPLALADDVGGDSLVGVVYRGWSLEDCKAVFGNHPYITNNLDAVMPMIEREYKENGYKGPLVKKIGSVPEITGCYCGADTKGTHYVANQEKTQCVLCRGRTLDPNALYYTDANAETGAILRVDGKDIGCRCAKKKGNDGFLRIENGKCVYGQTSQQDSVCQQRYGKGGVKVCNPNVQGETPIGAPIASGVATVNCCCDSDYKEEQTAETLGGWKCVKSDTAQDSACSQWGKQEKRGTLIECPEEFKGADISKLTDAQKEERDRRRVGPIPGATKPDGKPIVCCCDKDSANLGGVCVENKCDDIVPNSVMRAWGDANLSLPIVQGPPYPMSKFGPKIWANAITDRIKEQKVECFCKKGTEPFGDLAFTECRAEEEVSKKNVLFLARSPVEFKNTLFDNGKGNGGLFNAIKATAKPVSGKQTIECYTKGFCNGGIILDESGVFDFYNEDTGRYGRFVPLIAIGVVEAALGGWVMKTQYFARKAAKEAIKDAATEGGRTLTGTLGRKALKEASEEAVEQAIRLGGRTTATISDTAADAVIHKMVTNRITGMTRTTAKDAITKALTRGVGVPVRIAVKQGINVGTAAFASTAADAILIDPSTKSSMWATAGTNALTGCAAGALTGGILGAGFFSWAGAPLGCLIGALSGAASGLATDYVDPTELQIRFNSNQKGSDVENLLVSNDLNTCSKLDDGSGIRFLKHTYSSTEIDGWAFQGFGYESTACGLLDGGGGGFMVATLEMVGDRIKCTGCRTISGDMKCGDLLASAKDPSWPGNPVCCSECTIEEGEITEPYNMPGSDLSGFAIK